MVAAPPKVLLVSENLGTPSFRRTWHDYSVACLEQIKAAGAEVTLVVERAFGFEAGAKPGAINAEARLTALYEYLLVGGFEPRLFYKRPLARLLALYAPAALRVIARRQQRRALSREVPFANRVPDVGGLPDQLGYLRAVDRFLYPPRFYAAANLRAIYDTGPAEIDATGYDVVVIDGLLPIRVTGAAADRIVTIVHDMSAVSAPDARMKARLVAGQALLRLAEHRGTICFATEDARCRFNALAAAIPRRADVVLGPLASARVRRLATQPLTTEPAAFVSRQAAKARKAAFLRAVSPKGILERLLLDLAKSPNAADRGAERAATPIVVLMWPAAADDDLRPVAALAAELAGFATLVVFGLEQPTSPPPRIGTPAPPVIDLPDNLDLAGEPSRQDRVDVMRQAALVVYPDRGGAGPKLLEAVALARPILCFDTPVNREFVGEADASFMSPGARSVSGAIRAYLARTGSETALSTIGPAPDSTLPAHHVAETWRELLDRSRQIVSPE